MKRGSLVLAVCWLAVAGCRRPCESQIRQAVSSPDDRHMATVLVERCGGAPLVTFVSIHRVEDDFDPEDRVFEAEGDVSATVAWASASTLVISAVEGEVHQRDTEWEQLVIRYEPVRKTTPVDVVPVPKQ